MAVKGINWFGFLLRLLVAFVLVFSSYNPSGYSYYHWVSENISSLTPTIALVGILLLVGWTIFLRATLRSLGPFGLLLAAAFMGVLLWMMIDWGWFRCRQSQGGYLPYSGGALLVSLPSVSRGHTSGGASPARSMSTT